MIFIIIIKCKNNNNNDIYNNNKILIINNQLFQVIMDRESLIGPLLTLLQEYNEHENVEVRRNIIYNYPGLV